MPGSTRVISREGVPNRRYVRTPATAPGPSGPQMLRHLREIRNDPLGFLQRMSRAYGGVLQFPIPSPPTYLVSDPEAVRQVLVERARDYDKETVQYRSLSLVTGEGLLTTSGQVWRRQRRMVQPAFHRSRLDDVVSHAQRAAGDCLRRWGDISRGGVIDIDEAMMRVALETVGASLFGTDLSADADRLARATLEALDVVVSSAQVPVRLPGWTRSQRRLAAAMRELDVAVEEMVSVRMADASAHADLLGLLIEAVRGDDPIPLQEVRDELVSFMVAGHETAASALTWSLWLLAGDGMMQDRAAAEARRLVGSGPLAMSHLDDAVVLRAVVDEAMRLYPPVWLVTRRATVDDVLGGREVPAGSLVIMTPYLAQRDPSAWPDPEAFRPDRFLGPRRGGRDDDAAYWPFGLGPRMCIGRDFAYVEAITVLATMLADVTVSRLPHAVPPRAVPLVTLRPEGGLELVVSPRA